MAVQQGPTPDGTGMEHQQIRRGAQAEATDGFVGTVEQIVVDRNTGELRALVIRSADGRSEFELPAEYVQRYTGDHVYLTLSNEQIANNPRLAQPYDPNQYVPVYEGQMEPVPAATEAARETRHPIVTDVGTDSAQVVAPVTPEQPTANQPPVTATQAALSPERGQPTGPRATSPESHVEPTTAAPEVVAPSEALPEQGMTPQPGVTNAPLNPTREHTAGGVLQTPITDAPLTPENAGQLTVPEQQALDESRQLFRYEDIYPQGPQRTTPPPLASNPHAEPYGDIGPLVGKLQSLPLQRDVPHDFPPSTGQGAPEPVPTPRDIVSQPQTGTSSAARLVGLAVAGLAAAAGTGALIALLRRRTQPGVAQSAVNAGSHVAGSVLSALGDTASSVQDAAGQAAESVRSASKSAAQTLAATGQSAGATIAAVNWRPRVFRWGLLLGALGGMLFAPHPGRVTRDRLAHQLNRVFSRAS